MMKETMLEVIEEEKTEAHGQSSLGYFIFKGTEKYHYSGDKALL